MPYWWLVLSLVVGLMSGVLSLLRELYSLYRPEQTLTAKRKTFWVLVRIAFIVSAVLAWYGEHKQVSEQSALNSSVSREFDRVKQELTDTKHALGRERDQNQTKFEGVVYRVTSGYSPNAAYGAGAVQVFVLLSIRNTGAPSIAENFQLRVKSENVDVMERPTAIAPGFKLYSAERKVIATFTKDDSIYDRTVNKPIERGSQIVGWLAFVFRGLKLEQHPNSTEYYISFADIQRNTYTVPYLPSDHAPEEGPKLTYPGATDPFKRLSKKDH